MKKNIKFFIFACLCFILANSFVKADTVKFNGTTMTSSNYVVMPSGNRTITFNTDAVYSDIADYSKYYLLTVCADNDKITSWSINNSSLSTVNIYDTSYNCSFPNSSYTGGHVVYIYGSYNPNANCSSSLTNCVQNGSFTLNNPSSSSWALLSYQNSKDTISIDYASNSIISQNKDIINQQQQIINQNQQNTENIINNNNTNTQNIINNQNENLQTCKRNFIDINNPSSKTNANTSVNDKTLLINFTANYAIIQFSFDAKPNTTYNFSYNERPSSTFYTSVGFYNDNSLISNAFANYGGVNRSFTTTKNTNKIVLSLYSSNVQNVSISDLQITEGSTKQDYIYFNAPICTSKLDDVNNTLTDDNVSDDNASSFFSDFNLTDNGGISSIVTAPLVAIEAMLNNSCTALSGTWRGSTFELPCGTDFWNRMSTIRTWLNVAIGGLLCYRIIIKLFKLVEGFKNPENDKVEVMNL